MNKRRIVTGIAIVAALILAVWGYQQIVPREYIPADDEIALHVQMDTKEDIGLLVYDYRVDGSEKSGGISNADKSFIKHDSELTIVWNQQELECSSEAADFLIQFRIITEYVDPNFENIYPAELTESLDPISWKAHFGESYEITITGDKISGYQAQLN